MELNECIITGIYNCPHEKIDGKTCSYCKIPDEIVAIRPINIPKGDKK